MTTKLQETINGMGGNIQPILDQLKKSAENVLALQAKRDEVNASIAEERASVKALGISKQAFDFGLRRQQMDVEKRDLLDANYSVVCDALGVPLKQGDLFTSQAKENEDGSQEETSEETSIGEQQAEAIANAG